MIRYFLTDIIGTGDPDGDDYRSPIMDYPVHVECEWPWDEVRNTPLNRWVLAEVKSGDVSTFANDTRVMPLPAVTLDATYGAMDLSQKAALSAALGRWGIAVAPDAPDTFGEILAMIRIRANAGNNNPTAAQLTL